MVKYKQCGNDFNEQYGVCPKCGWVYEEKEKLPEIKQLIAKTLGLSLNDDETYVEPFMRQSWKLKLLK